ncbi:hypothetical protein ACEXQE_10185 [Herbiconiux sp. P17]|uniref:hypothetical protein n=1 Tax=Herbiconiux wuyangfengii TaxID=3342794 RepID=UPI0035B94DB9
MTSTRNLLGYGLRALRSARFIETTRDPVMTMLSIGVEKLLKLVVGVIALHETQSWPSKATMMSFGHGIVALSDHTLKQVRTRTNASSDYVKGLVDAVDADPVLQPLLAALDRYGKAGRFYNLDLLADSPQTGQDPAHLWNEAEQAALRDPIVDQLYQVAMKPGADNDAWDAFYSAVQGRLADSVEGFWWMLSRVGINHAFGITGETLGWEVAPNSVGRQ